MGEDLIDRIGIIDKPKSRQVTCKYSNALFNILPRENLEILLDNFARNHLRKEVFPDAKSLFNHLNDPKEWMSGMMYVAIIELAKNFFPEKDEVYKKIGQNSVLFGSEDTNTLAKIASQNMIIGSLPKMTSNYTSLISVAAEKVKGKTLYYRQTKDDYCHELEAVFQDLRDLAINNDEDLTQGVLEAIPKKLHNAPFAKVEILQRETDKEQKFEVPEKYKNVGNFKDFDRKRGMTVYRYTPSKTSFIGKFIKAFNAVRDLDEIKKELMQREFQVRELMDKNDEATARAMYQERGMIASVVLHDAKNEAMKMWSLAELGIRASTYDKRGEILGRIRSAAEQMSDNFIDGIRSESLFKDLNFQETNIRALLRGCAANLQKYAKANGLDIEVRVNNNIKPYAKVDKKTMNGALDNLTKNAIEATKEKEVKSKVVLRVEEDKSNVIIFVMDKGKGMDNETLKKIGTPYYTTKEGGNGIGVYYIKRTVELHKGRLEIQSKPEEGTAFIMYLPKNRK